MQRPYSLLLRCVIWSAVVGCGLPAETLELPIGIELDKNFSQSEQQVIKHDLEWLIQFESSAVSQSMYQQPKRLDQWFESIFGGSDISSVPDFIDTRIDYLVAPSTNPIWNVFTQKTFQMGLDSSRVAYNLGTVLFFASLSEDQKIYYNFNDIMLSVDDTRVGLVHLSPSFFKLSGNEPNKSLQRTSVIVHESRHSDCTGGVHESQITKLGSEAFDPTFQCGHTHIKCPKGHDYENLSACDASPWGAYSVEAVFASRVSQCESCDEFLIQSAMITALDRISRVLPAKKMISGQLGKPDLSSTNKMIEDLKP